MFATHIKSLRTAVMTVFLTTFPPAAVPQSYKSLWKKVNKACSQGLPKTALRHLDAIIDLPKNDNAQQLKALITRLAIAKDISEDSARAMLPKIEAAAQDKDSDTDISLWNMVLGWLYAKQDTRLYPQSGTKAIAAFRKATANAGALAATSSRQYLPVIRKGNDSRYYGHDMLSIVFPFAAQQLHNMHTPETDSLSRTVMGREIEYYRSVGNRTATLLAKMDSVSITASAGKQAYRKLIEDFKDCPLVSEVYAELAGMSADSDAYRLVNTALDKYPGTSTANRLRNTLTNITLPTIQCSIGQGVVYPDEEVAVSIVHRNTVSATLTCTRLPFKASDSKLRELTEKDYAKLSQKPDFRTELAFASRPPYEFATDTTHVRFPKSGVYLVKLQSPETKTEFQILHVSALAVVQLPLPGRKTRICIADNANGKPVANARISIRTVTEGTPSWRDYVCNGKGELTIDSPKFFSEIFASTADDEALPAKRLVMSHDYKWNFHDSSTQARIYTDRAVYRPGQTVKAGGFVYRQDGDSTFTPGGLPLNIELHNANGKLIESARLTTDGFGAFGTEFVLPKECLNGMFRIRCDHGSTSFRVEEYKRPTFLINVRQPNTVYSPGDTVYVEGDLATVSGHPMGNTAVYSRTVRNTSRWFCLPGGDSPAIRQDTVVTDSDGKFVLPVILSRPDGDSETGQMLYTYTVNVKATADDGETQESTLRIFAGNTKVSISTNIPDVICREHLPELIATQNNSMGKTVDGKGFATIVQGQDTLYSGFIDFNRKGQFDVVRSLSSGEYTITIFPEGETDRRLRYERTFTLLSLNDNRVSGKSPLQVWSSDSRFTDNKQQVHVMAGTPLGDTWLRYDLMANGKVIDSRLMHLNDTVVRFDYTYSETYGNGIHAQFALLADGKLHRKSVVITKPVPDKSLDIKWSTFRNKLTPGAEETWIMHVSKDSVPVRASILATMYDASLNKFRAHSLPFSLNYNRTVPMLCWSMGFQNGFHLSASKQAQMLKEQELDFSVPDPVLFNFYHSFGESPYGIRPRLAKGAMLYALANADNVQSQKTILEGKIGNIGATVSEDSLFDRVKLRTDFSETAFFTPSLKTNDQGDAYMEFKLPESITSWNFHALAHTTGLDYATTDTTITVEKPFAVHANVPRFLRNSDKTILPVNVTNNSGKEQSGKIRLTLTDTQTGRQMAQTTQPFCVGPGGNVTIGFAVSVPDNVSLMICHVAGISRDFTDAEQQFIPVLPDIHPQLSTVPFSVSDSASHTVSLEGLDYNEEAKNTALTFEYVANPVWTLLTAMPSTVDHTVPCATALAANYASLATVRSVLNRYPQIRTLVRSWLSADALGGSPLAALENNAELKNIILDESPWGQDAVRERQRLNALAQSDRELSLKQMSMLDRLRALQTSDGGWQWFPGMPSSLCLTLRITETLMRSNSQDSCCNDKTTAMTGLAMKYLERKIQKIVAELKENNAKELPDACMEYLHIMTMANRTDSPECRFLLSHLKKHSAHYNLYHKAVAASVLEAAGSRKEALALVRSLMEHTVCSRTTGQYFDSGKAPSSWNMYRIPMQLRTLETLRQVCPDSTEAIFRMKQWLLIGKHTQAWTDPLAAAQAIQELAGTWSFDSVLVLPATIELGTGKGKTLNILDLVGNNTLAPLGYIKATVPMNKADGKPVYVKIGDTGSSVSYGAVYLASRLSASQTKATGSGIRLRMTLYRETQEGWKKLTSNTPLHKGDRVKAHCTMQALRDLDFVSVRIPRAACMEPVSTNSGFRNGCYVTVEDAATTYFYDKVAKGVLAMEEIYDIDRQGTFSIAPAQAQCQYAPEFISTTPTTSVHVK